MIAPMFTICIPNFNYEHYLPSTIESVLKQSVGDFEIVIADNNSIDRSVDVINRYAATDARIHLKVNKTNVGFSRNLDKAASMATGSWMTMLSSDDLLHADFLNNYSQVIDSLGSRASKAIISSTQTVIDGEGVAFDKIGIDWSLWKNAKRDQNLTEQLGCDVYRIDARKLLRQSLLRMRTPFAFASMTYSRSLYDAVEGYSQVSIINPDKKFAWAILAEASEAIVIDKPLVKYRVHNRNQGAQQAASGALKHLTDQYIATFSLSEGMLVSLGLTRNSIEKAFVDEDIALRGLMAVALGNRAYARRAVQFGAACYPEHVRKSFKCWGLRGSLALGPFGTLLMRCAKKIYLPRMRRVADVPPHGSASWSHRAPTTTAVG